MSNTQSTLGTKANIASGVAWAISLGTFFLSPELSGWSGAAKSAGIGLATTASGVAGIGLGGLLGGAFDGATGAKVNEDGKKMVAAGVLVGGIIGGGLGAYNGFKISEDFLTNAESTSEEMINEESSFADPIQQIGFTTAPLPD